jgi:hypothetical protein
MFMLGPFATGSATNYRVYELPLFLLIGLAVRTADHSDPLTRCG